MRVILLLVVFSFSISLFSAPIVCESPNWSAFVSSKLDVAQLFFKFKPVKYGELKCYELFKTSPTSDIVPIVNCITEGVYDVGYSLYVYKIIENKELRGDLFQLSIIGSQKVTSLNCFGGYIW